MSVHQLRPPRKLSAADPKNPYAPGAANPFAQKDTPDPYQAPAVAPEPPKEDLVPRTTRPRQTPGGAPAPGSSRESPHGVQQGFASREPMTVRTLRDVEIAAPHLDASQRQWVYETIVRGSWLNGPGTTQGIQSDHPEFQKVVRDARVMPTASRLGAASALPPGWRVELLGLINAVQFTGPGKKLLWSDGQWTIEQAGMVIPAPGVGSASTQAEARAAGAAFLNEVFTGARHKASVGTGEGYYVLKGGQPISGPYDNPSYAHEDLAVLLGDAVEYLAEGHSREDLSGYPKLTDSWSSQVGRPMTRIYPPASRQAKVAEMVRGVLDTNPGMRIEEARLLALRTIERFPQMVRRAEVKERVEVTGPEHAILTIAEQVVPDLVAMDGTYEMEFVLNGTAFKVWYDQQGAVGDSGAPVQGDVTGDYEAAIADPQSSLGYRVFFRQHVSPHGTSGYGNSEAKAYAAGAVARAMAQSMSRTAR